MDLSKVGGKILSSVRSARSLGLLPSVSSSNRHEVPARAAAAAAVAQDLAGVPAHQRYSLPSSSKELSSMYGSSPHAEVLEELEEDFYEEEFYPIRRVSEHVPSEEYELAYFEKYADRIANSKWEVKELGMEHNRYVDSSLGEFKHTIKQGLLMVKSKRR